MPSGIAAGPASGVKTKLWVSCAAVLRTVTRTRPGATVNVAGVKT
jgi:hypothetical protein